MSNIGVSTLYGPFLKFEGSDLLLAGVPAGLYTFQVSGSVTAGNAVCLQTDGSIGLPTGVAASDIFVGVALKSAAQGDKIAVIVFGAMKNLVAAGTINFGSFLIPASNGGFTGSAGNNVAANRGVAWSAASSGSTFIGFVHGF
jgi:hypothetical protein